MEGLLVHEILHLEDSPEVLHAVGLLLSGLLLAAVQHHHLSLLWVHSHAPSAHPKEQGVAGSPTHPPRGPCQACLLVRCAQDPWGRLSAQEWMGETHAHPIPHLWRVASAAPCEAVHRPHQPCQSPPHPPWRKTLLLGKHSSSWTRAKKRRLSEETSSYTWSLRASSSEPCLSMTHPWPPWLPCSHPLHPSWMARPLWKDEQGAHHAEAWSLLRRWVRRHHPA